MLRILALIECISCVTLELEYRFGRFFGVAIEKVNYILGSISILFFMEKKLFQILKKKIG